MANILDFKKIFFYFGAIAGVELLSFATFNNANATSAAFALVCIVTTVIAWKNLGAGLLIAFGELFIGSQGYLFALERHGAHVPVRMGIFVVLLLVWLVKYFFWQYWKQELRTSHTVKLFIVFMCVWLVGVLLGLLYHNTLSNIIPDSNAYLYWLLFLPVWQARTNVWPNTLQLLSATVISTTLKTAFTWYVFSKQIFSHDTLELIYKWIRDTRVGEIVTYDRGGYVRVFFQSHIFELAGLFIFLALVLYSIHQKFSRLSLIAYSLLTSLSLATILMSLSRSFWLAGLATFALFITLLIFQLIFKKYNILSLTWKQIGLFLISCFLISGTAFTLSTLVGATTLGARATNTNEAAISSRWQLLPPLMQQVLLHPVIGSGFGTTVTYQSADPRIKNNTNPDGWYTTYAFEWGYLDIISKIGALGLAVYLVLILNIARLQIANLQTEQKFLSLGLLFGLVALTATHMFTPYLNHPLGIGYLLLLILLTERVTTAGESRVK